MNEIEKNEITVNKIAVVEQLPIITERIKEIGKNLDKRLSELKLDKLVCTEETRKDIRKLRTELGNELKVFEAQRKEIKKKINEPYEEFNKTYEEEIKTKYANADLILKNGIDVVEAGIKNNAKILAVEFFEEYKKSKSIIGENYITYEELNIQLGLDSLTEKGMLVKKVKDAITSKLDQLEKDIETINTMQDSEEILAEYLKHKNLSIAIKEVNDRHAILEQVKQQQELAKERKREEEKVIEKVEEVLITPTEEIIEGQMTIDDLGDTVSEETNMSLTENLIQTTFVVTGTLQELIEIREFLKEGGYNYECK